MLKCAGWHEPRWQNPSSMCCWQRARAAARRVVAGRTAQRRRHDSSVSAFGRKSTCELAPSRTARCFPFTGARRRMIASTTPGGGALPATPGCQQRPLAPGEVHLPPMAFDHGPDGDHAPHPADCQMSYTNIGFALAQRIRALNAARRIYGATGLPTQPTCSGYWPVAESSQTEPSRESGRSGIARRRSAGYRLAAKSH